MISSIETMENITTYSSDYINYWSLICLLGIFFTGLFCYEGPDSVQVDSWTEELVLGLVEIPHSNLTEVTRMAGKYEYIVTLILICIIRQIKKYPCFINNRTLNNTQLVH